METWLILNIQRWRHGWSWTSRDGDMVDLEHPEMETWLILNIQRWRHRLILNIHRLRSLGFLSSTRRRYCHRCCFCGSRIRSYSARRYSLFEARGVEYPNNVCMVIVLPESRRDLPRVLLWYTQHVPIRLQLLPASIQEPWVRDHY